MLVDPRVADIALKFRPTGNRRADRFRLTIDTEAEGSQILPTDELYPSILVSENQGVLEIGVAAVWYNRPNSLHQTASLTAGLSTTHILTMNPFDGELERLRPIVSALGDLMLSEVVINWGDGSSDTFDDSNLTSNQTIPHVYPTAGQYFVEVEARMGHQWVTYNPHGWPRVGRYIDITS